jgi:AAA+ ATPase superfamily predicted ATPase
MCEEQKQIWVNAILIDRFKYVMRGEAEVFFSYFVHDPEQLDFQHIKNREDVIAFWQTFSNSPNGGGTEVGDMVEHVAKEIADRKLHNLDIDLSEEKPEILIINDGQDSINSEKFPYKVNAISLMQFSDELKDLCLDTDGKQIKVTEDLQVFSYAKDVGEQQIKL